MGILNHPFVKMLFTQFVTSLLTTVAPQQFSDRLCLRSGMGRWIRTITPRKNDSMRSIQLRIAVGWECGGWFFVFKSEAKRTTTPLSFFFLCVVFIIFNSF
jgi:hypothetical protein